jgi:primosomal protein N' (replication factor Y)
MHYYEVLLKNVPQLLTYQSKEIILTGSLVAVTLGKKDVNGVIIEKVDTPDYDCVSIKKVHIEEAISIDQIELCRWMSNYYCSSLKRCIQLFIPSIIWNQKSTVKRQMFFELSSTAEEAYKSVKNAKKQRELIEFLQKNGRTDEKTLKKGFSSNIIKSVLEKKLILKIEGDLLNPDLHHSSKPHHNQALTIEQEKVLGAILNKENKKHRKANDEIKKQGNKEHNEPISSSFPCSLISSYLLHGVTGSGKTEVYLQIVKDNMSKGLQSVLLVPEIALTTELIQHFTEHFPREISILHSKLSDRERVQSWHRIHQGETKLILGSRSALFTPWKNLGTIIVDEEHEWTYKQESSPRYHVKKVAHALAELRKDSSRAVPSLKIILGSATPSIESYFEHSTLDSRLLTMSYRTNNAQLPPIHLIDLREEYQKKNYSMYSEKLQTSIAERLEKKEQVVLFLNKRGSSSSITCRDCGYTPNCEDCDISLTFHSKLKEFNEGGLICHYCGLFKDNIRNCPECQSVAIKYFGAGTQKAEQQLQELFPKARILRADKDTTGGKYDFKHIYHKMLDGEADILLGTQMIAKGLDLPNVTLTGVLLADIGLHIPDFRASERVFQLMTQVAGRSGRHKPGEVIIQSYQPDHPSLQAAKNYNYEGFYQQELSNRKLLNYSPFSKSIKLIFGHENPKIAEEEAILLYGKLQDVISRESRVKSQGTIDQALDSGPSTLDSTQAPTIELAPNYISKLHGKYLWNILIRSNNPREVLRSVKLPKGWKIDVDPM